MDTTDKDIVFDALGVCNHCNEYQELYVKNPKTKAQKDNELQELITLLKTNGKGKEYDCIAGISGGVDSTYVLYLLKKYGIRPLVVHLDNGWNSELATMNIENAIKILCFDLYTKVLNWTEFKELQVAYLKASVLDLEALSDHAITATLYQQAAKNNIKYLIAGTNIATEAILPLSWRYDNKRNDTVNIKDINSIFRKKPIKDFPLLSFQKFSYYHSVKKYMWLDILNLVDYNKEEAMQTIIKELGWRNYGGKHYESIITRFYQGYILYNKFGIDKRRAHLSTLINSGQKTRAEAIEILKTPPLPQDILTQDLEYVPKKLGLSQAEFKAIMEQPPKSHFDYKTDTNFRNLLFKINKFLKGKGK